MQRFENFSFIIELANCLIVAQMEWSTRPNVTSCPVLLKFSSLLLRSILIGCVCFIWKLLVSIASYFVMQSQ